MNNPVKLKKNNTLSIIAAAFLGFSVFSGLTACRDSSSPDNRPSLTIDAPSVVEGTDGTTAQLEFTITLSENAATALTVNYTTADDVATAADGDFTPTSGTVTIAAGTQSTTISVLANGDGVFEINETFNLVVNNPQGLDIKTPSITGKGTINNDDAADPKGYFSGTATLGGINLTDLTGMMFNSRLMLFSPSQNVLFDITAFNTIVFDYTATVDVYEAGVLTQSGISLSGTTDEASISGTFAGGAAGLATGSFNIVYDVNNNIGATLTRIEGVGINTWAGSIYGIGGEDTTGRFFSNLTTGVYTAIDFGAPSCSTSIGATLNIPGVQLNIYELNHRVIEDSSCAYITQPGEVNHTGFASVLSINSDDTLVYAYANGVVSLFGVLTK